MRTSSFVSKVAQITCKASFFAPCGVISPFRRCPPSITKVLISVVFFYNVTKTDIFVSPMGDIVLIYNLFIKRTLCSYACENDFRQYSLTLHLVLKSRAAHFLRCRKRYHVPPLNLAHHRLSNQLNYASCGWL